MSGDIYWGGAITLSRLWVQEPRGRSVFIRSDGPRLRRGYIMAGLWRLLVFKLGCGEGCRCSGCRCGLEGRLPCRVERERVWAAAVGNRAIKFGGDSNWTACGSRRAPRVWGGICSWNTSVYLTSCIITRFYKTHISSLLFSFVQLVGIKLITPHRTLISLIPSKTTQSPWRHQTYLWKI